MSKGKQLWPGDEMLAFFRAHIRRETSLDSDTTEKLAAALTRATNRMLVWEVPAEVEEAPPAAAPAPAQPQQSDEIQERHDRAENFNPYLFCFGGAGEARQRRLDAAAQGHQDSGESASIR